MIPDQAPHHIGIVTYLSSELDASGTRVIAGAWKCLCCRSQNCVIRSFPVTWSLWVIWIRLESWLTSALSFIVRSASSELDVQELQILIPIFCFKWPEVWCSASPLIYSFRMIRISLQPWSTSPVDASLERDPKCESGFLLHIAGFHLHAPPVKSSQLGYLNDFSTMVNVWVFLKLAFVVIPLPVNQMQETWEPWLKVNTSVAHRKMCHAIN